MPTIERAREVSGEDYVILEQQHPLETPRPRDLLHDAEVGEEEAERARVLVARVGHDQLGQLGRAAHEPPVNSVHERVGYPERWARMRARR